jgi:transposase
VKSVIETEMYAQIRKHKAQGFSQQQTSQQLGIARNTVRRYWDGAHTPDEQKAYPATIDSPQKKQIMKALSEYYEKNSELTTGKQKINAKTAWKELRETYSVGESTVRRYVREMKGEKQEGFIPLSFEPGEVMQVDWCEVKVNIQGNLWKAPVFCAVLPYSYGIFAMIMPNMKTPCFLEAGAEAFQFFGGVPRRIFYDNLRTAVFSGSGKDAVKQERFRMFEAHFAFEAVFMNVAAGNEKGSVENLCSLIRQVAFTPIPKGRNLREIQEQVVARCLDYINFHKIRDHKEAIAPMLEKERLQLMPLPVKPFSAYADAEVIVGTDLTFRYDTTKYSVPQEYIGKKLDLRITSYQIEAWYKGKIIFTHARPFVKGDHQYIPEHYLPLLEKRPRAVQNAIPLKFGVMPPELVKFRKLNMDKDRYEQLTNILLLGRQYDAEALLLAVEHANKSGIPTYDAVRFYLEAHEMKIGKPIDITSMDTVIVDKPQFENYDRLLEGVHNE